MYCSYSIYLIYLNYTCSCTCILNGLIRNECKSHFFINTLILIHPFIFFINLFIQSLNYFAFIHSLLSLSFKKTLETFTISACCLFQWQSNSLVCVVYWKEVKRYERVLFNNQPNTKLNSSIYWLLYETHLATFSIFSKGGQHFSL